jgi:plasmid stabilization system protein ParE
MPRKVIFEPEARLEFEEAVAHYNERKPGLGGRFEADVDAMLRRVTETPKRFRLVGKTVRIARLKVFTKYAIYYYV